jgi:hypothetical protein
MAAKSPAQIAEKWARNLGAAGESIRQGVEAVTEAPGQKAAARSQAYLDGVMRAVSSGKWAENVGKVSLADWKNSMVTKGLGRIAAGATAAKGKMQSFMAEFLPYEQRVVSSLPPRGDLAQNIERMVAVVRANAEFKRSR